MRFLFAALLVLLAPAASAQTVVFTPPNPSIACNAAPLSPVATVALSNSAPAIWSLTGDSTDFALTGGNQIVVSPNGIRSATCNTTAQVVLTVVPGSSTSTTVPIVITPVNPGGAITTYTFLNNSGATLPAGFPITLGQGFARGAVLSGNQVRCQDPNTSADLNCQWDQIATRHQNGDDGSWRHAVWTINLPQPLAAGATYSPKFVSAPGPYSQTSALPVSSICTHALKIRLTDIRNQDDTARDSGAATFDLCANSSNVGRDAPVHYASGSKRDGYQIKGQFVYDTSGHKDPLLYARCDVDLYTASGTTSLGNIRYVCEVMNPWMNVAAGSAGNAGSPGPVGFANDPQAISYRAAVLDGATTVLDWSGMDLSLASANNPVASTGCGGDFQLNFPACLTSAPTGANSWYWGGATRVACTGTCLGGLTNGSLYFMFPTGTFSSGTSNGAYTVALKTSPNLGDGPPYNTQAMTASQGTGTTSFSTRIWHAHNMYWYSLDASGDENWVGPGNTRVTHEIVPAFTVAERKYWETTGVMLPLDLTQTTGQYSILWGVGDSPYYNPLGRLNIIGTNGPGFRPDIGVINEYAAQAWVGNLPAQWTLAREFTFGGGSMPWNGMLNEATGYIPAFNNGPPVGPVGNGIGNSYPTMGAPFPTAFTSVQAGSGIADALGGVPNSNLPAPDYWGGFWGNPNTAGTSDHDPETNGISYMVWGSQHFLDDIYLHGNRLMIAGASVGPGYTRRWFNPDGTNTFWGLGTACCQTRGSDWMLRGFTFGAMYGADANPESIYYSDELTENNNYWPAFVAFKNGPGNNTYTTGYGYPNDAGTYEIPDTFIAIYTFMTAYLGYMNLRVPYFHDWTTQTAKVINALLGGSVVPGQLDPYYGVDFTMNLVWINGDIALNTGNIGGNLNATDLSQYVNFSPNTYFQAPATFRENSSYVLTNGDLIKNLSGGGQFGPVVDQLPGTQFLQITNVSGPTAFPGGLSTFQIVCPVGHPVTSTCPTPGSAFTGFTSGGAPISDGTIFDLGYRMAYVPARSTCDGVVDNTYIGNAVVMAIGTGLLGSNTTTALNNLYSLWCFPTYQIYGPSLASTSLGWDSSIVLVKPLP